MDAKSHHVCACQVGDRSRTRAKRLWVKLPHASHQHAYCPPISMPCWQGDAHGTVPGDQHVDVERGSRSSAARDGHQAVAEHRYQPSGKQEQTPMEWPMIPAPPLSRRVRESTAGQTSRAVLIWRRGHRLASHDRRGAPPVSASRGPAHRGRAVSRSVGAWAPTIPPSVAP
jgi:hypothetical protein